MVYFKQSVRDITRSENDNSRRPVVGVVVDRGENVVWFREIERCSLYTHTWWFPNIPTEWGSGFVTGVPDTQSDYRIAPEFSTVAPSTRKRLSSVRSQNRKGNVLVLDLNRSSDLPLVARDDDSSLAY